MLDTLATVRAQRQAREALEALGRTVPDGATIKLSDLEQVTTDTLVTTSHDQLAAGVDQVYQISGETIDLDDLIEYLDYAD